MYSVSSESLKLHRKARSDSHLQFSPTLYFVLDQATVGAAFLENRL